jgi:hypothetical protein
MKKEAIIIAVFAFQLVLVSAIPGFAAAKFGLVYDIKGTAEIVNSLGKSTQLDRSRHLLLPVKVGDRIRTSANAKVTVVALNSKIGYEIKGNSEGVVEANGIRSIKGELKSSAGYAVPTGQSSGPMGAIILRGRDKGECMTPISPANTSVVTLTPELSWSVNCKEISKVSLRIVENRKVIYSTATEGTSIKVPEGLLKYGRSYAWIIDAGQASAAVESEFSIPPDFQVGMIQEKMAANANGERDVTSRISYMFYLVENDLREQARAELDSLKKEFPENDYLKEL